METSIPEDRSISLPNKADIVKVLIGPATGVNLDDPTPARVASLIDETSRRILITPVGENGMVAIRVILASALAGRDNPEMLERLAPRATGINFEGMDRRHAGGLIEDASGRLIRGPLGISGTTAVRVMFAAGLAGSDNPAILNNIPPRPTGVHLEPPDQRRLDSYIDDASSRLSRGPLGLQGTTAVRVLIASAIAGSK